MTGTLTTIAVGRDGRCLGNRHPHDGRCPIAAAVHYDLGYFVLEQKTLQPLDKPFRTRLSPMS
jgi:hypothetical protein